MGRAHTIPINGQRARSLHPDPNRPAREEDFTLSEGELPLPFLNLLSGSTAVHVADPRPALSNCTAGKAPSFSSTCCHVCYSEKPLPASWGQGTCLFTYLEQPSPGTHRTEYPKHNRQTIKFLSCWVGKINLRPSFRLSVISAGQITPGLPTAPTLSSDHVQRPNRTLTSEPLFLCWYSQVKMRELLILI